MKIERVGTIITVDQLLELVKLAVSSKTNELEIEVARSLRYLLSPPYMTTGDPSDFANLKPGEIRYVSDDQ